MLALPPYEHIVVVVEENHDYGHVIGRSKEAPFINALAAKGSLLSNFQAVAHPSEPNYFALYAGSTFGVEDDGHYTEPGPTLASILQTAGRGFRGMWTRRAAPLSNTSPGRRFLKDSPFGPNSMPFLPSFRTATIRAFLQSPSSFLACRTTCTTARSVRPMHGYVTILVPMPNGRCPTNLCSLWWGTKMKGPSRTASRPSSTGGG